MFVRKGGFAILVLLCAVIFGTANPALAADAAQGAPAQTIKASAPAADQHSPPLYSEHGATTCLTCHNQVPVTHILQTPHAMKGDPRTPFGQHDCESCHGPSEAHAKDPLHTSPSVVFKGPKISPVGARNEVCLTCHQNGLRMDWAGSQHQNNNVACVSCHTVHVTKDPVLVKATQPEKCFTCHAEQRAQSFQFSHHPIREGKVVCADCHNPHGSSGPHLLKELSVNDTCYGCHAEKRGPFLWEHEPVREDCTNCHVPHGSTQARLLKERPPFLCMNCHNTDGHNANPFSASNLPSGPAMADARAVSARLLARGCVNCHSQVHGSNDPSGSHFTR